MIKEEFYPTHIHKEKKTKYMLKYITNLEATKPGWICQAVYIDEIGNIWSRPYDEFKEKYEEL